MTGGWFARFSGPLLPALAGAALLSSIFLLPACKRPESARTSRQQASSGKGPGAAERRQIASRLEAALKRAGGSEVWIKERKADRDALGSGPPVEVLVLSRVFDSTLEAFRRDAESARLELRRQEKAAKGARSAEVTVIEAPSGGGRPAIVGRWRFIAVERLYRAAIVIDDLGQNPDEVRRLLGLPFPLTFSVLPHLPDSVENAEQVHRAHREVMLHLPMQPGPASALSPGPGALRVGMGPAEVARIIDDDLASVPYVAGVNNHMGSRATTDPALMAAVMKELGERRLYFIDSRTTADTVALDAARAAGLPTFYRSVFLDDEENVDYTLGQLARFRELVERQGMALAIGHPHPTTIAALARFLPQFERDNIELVSASELVRLPEAARLHPPRKAAASK